MALLLYVAILSVPFLISFFLARGLYRGLLRRAYTAWAMPVAVLVFVAVTLALFYGLVLWVTSFIEC